MESLPDRNDVLYLLLYLIKLIQLFRYMDSIMKVSDSQ